MGLRSPPLGRITIVEGQCAATQEREKAMWPPLRQSRTHRQGEHLNMPFHNSPAILHVAESFAGGVMAAVRDYVGSTTHLRHHILYADRPDAPIDVDDLRGFETVSRLPRTTLARVRAIRLAVRTLTPQAVHAHSSFAGAYTRAAVNSRRVPIVYTPHCYSFERTDINAWSKLTFRTIEHILSLNTSVFAACSPREASLSEWRGSKASVNFVPNLPPSGDLNNASHRSRRENGLRLVGAGRASRQKDPMFFLRAVQMVERTGVPFEAMWIGSDPGFGARGRALNIEVTGWLRREEALRKLAENDIYLHTGLWEGFPVAVLEALDAGVATVVRDVPAFAGVDLPKVAKEIDVAELALQVRGEDDTRRLWSQGVLALRDNTRDNQASVLRKVYEENSVGYRDPRFSASL